MAMTDDASLERYLEKRDFKKTPEPQSADSRANDPIFVIQQHDASSLHYDFRLAIGGTLKSWAVPKGPSTDPREKRLAIRTEDHPLSYADFEGVIPEGEYGAGTVLVWDAGMYRNLKKDEEGNEIPMEECLEKGHLTVWIEGEKLTGGYALTRAGVGEEDEENWLLVKMDDEEADARRVPVSTEPESVLTGRTLEEVRTLQGEEDGEGDVG